MRVRTKSNLKSSSEDAPRYLTEEEIESILVDIPYPYSVTRKKAALARDQILQVLRADLSSIMLCPSGIPDIAKKIIMQFEESRAKPGSMVGLAAAEAPSQRFQQDTLSATHKAGSTGMIGAGGAVARVSDLINKQQNKNTTSEYDSCLVFFNDIQTQHSIMHDKRPDMVSISLFSLMITGPERYQIEYLPNIFEDGKLPPWYHVYCKLYGVPLPDVSRESRKILRLYLDVEKLVEHKVMLSQVRKALQSANSRVLRYYISPMHMGIIDVWVIEEEMHAYGQDLSKDLDLDSLNFLHGFAEQWVQRLNVKGIPGIRDLQTAKIDIWAMMTLGQTHKQIRDNVYKYNLSTVWPTRFGWGRPELLWKFLNITMVSRDESGKDSWVVLDGGSNGPPHEILTTAIKKDEDNAKEYQKAAVTSNKLIVTRPTTPENTTYWSELWYGKTEGTNLREIIVRDDVDQRYTISNRPYEVLELYGIIAARRVMLEELYKAFEGGREKPDFSVRHFALLADFVCHTGVIRPINNLMIQGRSTLSKATLAKHFSTLVSPAIYGVEDPIGDVSTSIMIASRAKIGPKAFEYEEGINEGVTAEEIKTKLRLGSRSDTELEKMIAFISETADVPLYVVGNESGGALSSGTRELAAADEGEEGEGLDVVIAQEYEAEDLPPGVEDEEPKATMIDDDLDDLVVDNDEGPKRQDPDSVVMSPALRSAVSTMGGTIVEAGLPMAAEATACPVQRKSSKSKKGKSLRFVEDS